jgi:hypothetical protein
VEEFLEDLDGDLAPDDIAFEVGVPEVGYRMEDWIRLNMWQRYQGVILDPAYVDVNPAYPPTVPAQLRIVFGEVEWETYRT